MKLYKRLLGGGGQFSFKVGNFTDFKAFFSSGDDGFSLTVPCQKLKKKTVEGSVSVATEEYRLLIGCL